MKILLMSPAFHPAIGGMETYARVLARGLTERGHDVLVVTDGARGSAPAEDTVDGVPTRRLHHYRQLLDDPAKVLWQQMSFGLLSELDSVVTKFGRPDLVLANSHDTAVLATMLAAHHGDLPVVATYHEQDRERTPLGVGRSKLVYGILPLTALIAGSGFYRDKAIRFGTPPERVHHLPHGVDLTQFSGTPKPRAGAPFTVLLSGRISPRKGQVFLVEVLARLRKDGHDVRVVLAGRAHSSDQSYVDKLADEIRTSGVGDAVELKTDVDHSGMPQLYREADLVVQPSTEEGLGLAVLEAMACGAPVAVNDTDGLDEVITDPAAGLKLPVGDVDAWVGAIAGLAGDDARRYALAVGGQAHVARYFDERVMLDRTADLLGRIHAGEVSRR